MVMSARRTRVVRQPGVAAAERPTHARNLDRRGGGSLRVKHPGASTQQVPDGSAGPASSEMLGANRTDEMSANTPSPSRTGYSPYAFFRPWLRSPACYPPRVPTPGRLVERPLRPEPTSADAGEQRPARDRLVNGSTRGK